MKITVLLKKIHTFYDKNIVPGNSMVVWEASINQAVNYF